MNCKPGDVALVVRCCGERNCKNLGKMVRCIQIGGMTITGRPVWEIEGLLEWYVSRYPLVKDLLPLAPDYCLMPIPPLGDDACSESSTGSSAGSSAGERPAVAAGAE